MDFIKKIPIAIIILLLISTTAWAQQAPVLDPIGAKSVDEGANLNLLLTASDPDLTTPTFTAVNVPTNATFTDNSDGTATFDFNPDYTQATTYDVTFIATDGSLSDTEIVTITVNNVNLAPVLATIGSKNVDEGANLNVLLTASDADGTTPTFTAVNVPTNATFIDNSDGTATFDFNPDFTQATTYDITFIATDGSLSDTEIVTITVNNVNLAPVLAAIGSKNVDEGANLNVIMSASDPDLTTPSFTAVNVPTNATFTDNSDGTATFDFNPDFTQATTYDVTFIATDGLLSDTEIVTITVNNVNQAPVLAAIGSKNVDD
ncbi:MAG: Ig-like domain-containing protein, partial [bacterium]